MRGEASAGGSSGELDAPGRSMFEFKATQVETGAVESDAERAVADAARAWLERGPDAREMLGNPAAVELAVAEGAGFGAIAQAAEKVDLQALAGLELARWILLNVTAWQVSGEGAFRAEAEKGFEEVRARFDEELEYFRSDEEGVFATGDNAALAEMCYLAWRAFDDGSLRPIAGTVLGAVGERCDADAGLFERAKLPEGRGAGPDRAGPYAATVEMYLTASETTGRGTYVSRAAIVADMWKARRPGSDGRDAAERAALARALVRLEEFMPGGYRELALELLDERPVNAGDLRAAGYVLARREAREFPRRVVVIGDVAHDSAAGQMWQLALESVPLPRAVEALDPARQASRIAALGYEPDPGGAVAYVCAGVVCYPPVRDAAGLKGSLRASAQPKGLKEER